MTRIFVDTHNIRDNRRLGRNDPVITIEHAPGVRIRGHEAVIRTRGGVEVGRVVYRPGEDAPRVWIQLEDGATVELI